MLAVQVEITITNLIYALAGVTLGYGLGKWRTRKSHPKEHKDQRAITQTQVRVVLAFILIGMVLLSLIVDAFNPVYDPPAGINTILTAVATFLFVRTNGDKPKEGTS